MSAILQIWPHFFPLSPKSGFSPSSSRYKKAPRALLRLISPAIMLSGKVFVFSFLAALVLLETVTVVEGQGFLAGLFVGALL